jgi:hypothetical protein
MATILPESLWDEERELPERRYVGFLYWLGGRKVPQEILDKIS